MSHEITREQRIANIAHWRFQNKLMAEQGFPKVYRTMAAGNPRAYEHGSGQWRISTALGRKWKLEYWSGRTYYPQGYWYVDGLKVWVPSSKRFDTPLAVALWFHIMLSAGMPARGAK